MTPSHSPDTQTWMWGVDPHTNFAAIAAVMPGPPKPTCVTSLTPSLGKSPASGKRHGELYTTTYDTARSLMRGYPPVAVAVELTTGKFKKPTLHEATGVIMAAIHNALVDGSAHQPGDIFTVNIARWRERFTGNARADKDAVRDTFAKIFGPIPRNMTIDEIEAAAIAASIHFPRHP